MMHRTIRGCLLSAVIAGGLLGANGAAANAAATPAEAPISLSIDHTTPPTGRAHVGEAAANAAPRAPEPGTAPNTGVNSGLLGVGVVLVVFGGVLALILGRKRG